MKLPNRNNRSPNIQIPKSWEIPAKEVTPESIYCDRRKFIKGLGKVALFGISTSFLQPLTRVSSAIAQTSDSQNNPQNFIKKEEVTSKKLVTHYNNFYEFSTNKSVIWKQAQALKTNPWEIRIEGLVKNHQVLDFYQLIKYLPQEERIYRLRCVEGWSVVIPWKGFPLKLLIDLVEPLSTARYIKFKTFLDPNIALGQKQRFWEPWPYSEGLSLKEAMHSLSFVATGMYGKSLQNQNGAPIRLVIPWKYGFKSIKSITSIEFTRDEPPTFWQTVSPLEYDFWANVDPSTPYARWDQRMELDLGKNRKIPTLKFNGYAGEVSDLYF